MVRKLNAWIVGVFILFAIHANGFKLFDSSDEKFDIDLDSDSAIDESDYWDWLSILPNPLRDANKNDKSTENEKLELTDDVGDDDDDDEIDEMVQLIEISEMHVMKKYFLGKRVRGILSFWIQLIMTLLYPTVLFHDFVDKVIVYWISLQEIKPIHNSVMFAQTSLIRNAVFQERNLLT